MSLTSYFWINLANNDHEYAEWLERIDTLCNNLINLSFVDFIEHECFDPLQAYRDGVRPEKFVVEYVIPQLQLEHGPSLIYETVGENAIWGSMIPWEK